MHMSNAYVCWSELAISCRCGCASFLFFSHHLCRKQNYGRILPSLLKLLKNCQLQNAENTKICILVSFIHNCAFHAFHVLRRLPFSHAVDISQCSLWHDCGLSTECGCFLLPNCCQQCTSTELVVPHYWMCMDNDDWLVTTFLHNCLCPKTSH